MAKILNFNKKKTERDIKKFEYLIGYLNACHNFKDTKKVHGLVSRIQGTLKNDPERFGSKILPYPEKPEKETP